MPARRMHLVMLFLVLAGFWMLRGIAWAQEDPLGDPPNSVTAPLEDQDADPFEKDALAKEALQKAEPGGKIPVEPASGIEDYKEGGTEIHLEAAVRKALEANPSIFSAKAQALAAEDFRKSSLGDFFPALTLGYSYTKYDHARPRDYVRSLQTAENFYQMTANVHQDIFTGFRLENSYIKARLSVEQYRENLRNTELNLIQNVQENFLTLLKAREDVRSAKDSVARLSSQLRVTQAFYDVGLKPKLDVLQAEVDLAKAEDELLQARNDVATQQARLNTLLTLSLDANVNYVGELEYVPFTLDVDECLKRAFDNRPDLNMAKYDVDIAKKESRIAFSELLPQVGADLDYARSGDDWAVNGGSWGTPAQTEFSQWSVSVSAQWKVFDFGSTWYSWRQAKKGVSRYEADELNLREEISYAVKAAHLDIGAADARIKVTRKALEQAKESYRMAVARYQAQVGTNTDVLDAQASLTEAEANLTQAMADYQTAISSMYVAMGMKNYNLRPE